MANTRAEISNWCQKFFCPPKILSVEICQSSSHLRDRGTTISWAYDIQHRWLTNFNSPTLKNSTTRFTDPRISSTSVISKKSNKSPTVRTFSRENNNNSNININTFGGRVLVRNSRRWRVIKKCS